MENHTTISRLSPIQVLRGSFRLSSGTTLYAPDATSQLLFDMRGMTDASMEAFNSLVDPSGKRRWAECVRLVAEEGVDPVFVGCETKALGNNLMFIRESMADVLAWMFRERLLVDTECRSVSSLCKRMAEQNPLSFPSPHFYEKVIKDFLFATFAGMTGSRPWNGEEQVNGGYIVVLLTGEVLCYHASDREQFRDYLFRNTYIEYVSCRKVSVKTCAVIMGRMLAGFCRRQASRPAHQRASLHSLQLKTQTPAATARVHPTTRGNGGKSYNVANSDQARRRSVL